MLAAIGLCVVFGAVDCGSSPFPACPDGGIPGPLGGCLPDPSSPVDLCSQPPVGDFRCCTAHTVEMPPCDGDGWHGCPEGTRVCHPDGTLWAGNPCGDIPRPCESGTYCEFYDHRCGRGVPTGTCLPLPDECPPEPGPFCACDGQLHRDQCEAAIDGFDGWNDAPCAAPTGTVACGPANCDPARQYCRLVPGEENDPTTYFGCWPFPPGCHDCTCLGTDRTTCQRNPNGLVMLFSW